MWLWAGGRAAHSEHLHCPVETGARTLAGRSGRCGRGAGQRTCREGHLCHRWQGLGGPARWVTNLGTQLGFPSRGRRCSLVSPCANTQGPSSVPQGWSKSVANAVSCDGGPRRRSQRRGHDGLAREDAGARAAWLHALCGTLCGSHQGLGPLPVEPAGLDGRGSQPNGWRAGGAPHSRGDSLEPRPLEPQNRGRGLLLGTAASQGPAGLPSASPFRDKDVCPTPFPQPFAPTTITAWSRRLTAKGRYPRMNRTPSHTPT